MDEKKLSRFLLFSAAALTLALLVFLFFRCFLHAALPFLFSFAAASAMEPAVAYLEKRLRLRRSFCSAVATLFALFLLGGLLAFFGVSLLRQAETLLTRLPQLAEGLPALTQHLSERLSRVGAAMPLWLRETLEEFFADFAQTLSSLLGTAGPWLLGKLGGFAAAVPPFLLAAATSVLAVYFTSAAYPTLRAWLRRLPQPGLEAAKSVRTTLLRWLRAQLALFSLTFGELLLGFTLLGTDFALLGAFLTALVDLLPVFGTGTVLIPWSLLSLLFGNAPRALGLAALYLTTLLVRNITEPKLLAAVAGVPPIVSLAAMYLGFSLFGVSGMLLFPLLLLLGCSIYTQKKEGQ